MLKQNRPTYLKIEYSYDMYDTRTGIIFDYLWSAAIKYYVIKLSCWRYGRSQDFLWGALFPLKSSWPFLFIALNTYAITATLTTPIFQPCPAQRKCPQKIDFFPSAGGALTIYPINHARKKVLALEVHLHPLHPLAIRLRLTDTFGNNVEIM